MKESKPRKREGIRSRVEESSETAETRRQQKGAQQSKSGGVRQRLGSHHPDTKTDPLTKRLRDGWAKGHITAKTVQACAADAASIADDSKVGPMLNQAAATGSGGSNPSNIGGC